MASLTKGLGSVFNATKKSGLNTKIGSSVVKNLTKNAGSNLLNSAAKGLINNTKITGGSGGTGIGDYISKFLGGGSDGIGGNIFEGLLAGLGGAADALISKEAVEEQGKQSRKTLDFEYALKDYYENKDRVRKRASLDSYGQFSSLDRWAPTYKAPPAPTVGTKPSY
jgi:hypothetical protein